MPQEYMTEEEWAQAMRQPAGTEGPTKEYGLGGATQGVLQTAQVPEVVSQAQAAPQAAQAPLGQLAQPLEQRGPPRKEAPPPGPEFSLRSYAARPGPYADLFAPITGALETGYNSIGQEA